MKKHIRLTAAVLTVCLLCLTFGGCNALDTMRQNRAEWQENRDILLDGVTYKQLPDCEDLMIDYTKSRSVTVVKPDIPLLLGDFFGDRGILTQDGVFLQVYSVCCYCRAAEYDTILAEMTGEKKYTSYYFLQNYYDEETYEYGQRQVQLTAEQIGLLQGTLRNQQPLDIDASLLEGQPTVCIFAATADGYFSRMFAEILKTERAWYLRVAAPDNTAVIYSLPAADDAQLNAIWTQAQEEDMEKFVIEA